MTVLLPWLPGATKSRPPVSFSETVSRTVSAAVVAPVRLTVKVAVAPSVMEDAPAVIVTSGCGCGTSTVARLDSCCEFGCSTISSHPSSNDVASRMGTKDRVVRYIVSVPPCRAEQGLTHPRSAGGA